MMRARNRFAFVALRKTTEWNDSPTQRNKRDLRCVVVALRTTTEWNGP